jgi:hypothetical protein
LNAIQNQFSDSSWAGAINGPGKIVSTKASRNDFEVSDGDLRGQDVIFVEQAKTNSALAAWKCTTGLESDCGLFRIAGKDHTSETER